MDKFLNMQILFQVCIFKNAEHTELISTGARTGIKGKHMSAVGSNFGI
jgi:hypothetical protein